MATKQPDDKSYFILPDLGEGVDTVDVVAILVSVGDRIEEEQGLIEVETEKASVEVPSSTAGTIGKPGEPG